MACSCGNKKDGSKKTFTVTIPGKPSKTFSTEIEARAAASRLGGTVKVS